MEGGHLWRKVAGEKRQAYYNHSAAAVFVVDSEGGVKELEEKRASMEKGRDAVLPEFPTAIGIAHPCIESWLLADGPAIRRALNLKTTPQVPEQPEDLPAPCRDPQENPKVRLCRLVGSTKKELSADEKDRIAAATNDLDLLRQRCPLGFAPFAEEVERHIRPLFAPVGGGRPTGGDVV